MNLAELAAFVCAKARKDDAASLASCKDFLKRRDQMLWDGHLWRDSLFEFTQELDPDSDTLLANTGIFLMPDNVSRVLGLRATDRPVPVEARENYFRTSLDAFAQTGTPLEFSLLSPVVWQWHTSTNISVVSGSDDDGTARLRYIDANNETQSEESPLSTAAVPWGVKVLEEFTKPTTTGSVTIEKIIGSVSIATLAPEDTRAPQKQRIQLLPVPAEAETFRFLVKKKYEPLASDYEEPRLRQSENTLIAYALGDMLQRRQQFGKARECFAEGAALLADLVSLEVDQQARNERLVPDIEPWPDASSQTSRLKAYN